MTPFLSVTITNHLSELERVHAIVWQFGKSHQFSEVMINNINLALEEIVTNVIEHGYEDSNQHFIIIRFSLQEGEVIAEVEDDAQPFNPLKVPVPDLNTSLEDRPIGGLGIHLVRNVMDTMDYRNHEGKNCLKLTKKIAGG